MADKCEYGLLIDYEYCTGCYACQVACAQEYNWPAGMGGIRVIEVEQKLPNDRAYLAFLPFPTELCILCAPRTRQGLEPACVKHCMAQCLKYGPIDGLTEESPRKRKTVIWTQRKRDQH